MAPIPRFLSRRAFLRGVGVSLALPLLDAGDPAAPASGPTQAPVRLGFFYVPNGVVMANWKPKATGTEFDFPEILRPLQPLKQRVTVLSDLAADHCIGEIASHEPAGGAFLVGAKCKRSEEPEVGGISVDQLAARHLGEQTPVDALTLGIEPGFRGDHGYSGTYLSHMSWRSTTSPAPLEINPKELFNRLFHGQLPRSPGLDRDARPPADSVEGSILDLVRDDARDLRHHLGSSDRDKMEEYLEGVRGIERRIAGIDPGTSGTPEPLDARIREPVFPEGKGIPKVYADHVNLLLDILVMAFQTDTTRVASFMFGMEKSGRSYPEIGAPGSHHSTSHHDNKPENLAELTKINTHHLGLFARMLRRMGEIREGDRTLLDNVVFLYGCGISDGNKHNHDDLPILLAGGGGGTLTGGRHIAFGKKTPICNVYLDMLARAGLPVEKFGDSTGRLTQLS
jgi:hypothetical protein